MRRRGAFLRTTGEREQCDLAAFASLFTSSITGRAPVPVPMIRRRHCQGIFSSIETGVCPNSSRNFFEGFFLRLRTSPRWITTSCSYVTPSIRIEPKEKFWKRILYFQDITPESSSSSFGKNLCPTWPIGFVIHARCVTDLSIPAKCFWVFDAPSFCWIQVVDGERRSINW